MLLNLTENIVLLLGLLTLYSVSAPFRVSGKLWSKIIMGMLFGGIAIVGMRLPLSYSPGVFYDGRSIILSLAGLFGGGVTTIVAIIVAGVYRAIIGGNGMWAGLATILSSGMLGLIFRNIFMSRAKRFGLLQLWIVGVSVHIAMLACQLLVQPWPAGVSVIKQIWVLILLIFPAATVFMGVLIQNENQRILTQEELKKSEAHYHDLVETSQDLIWQCDAEGRYTFLNPAWEKVFGYKVEKMLGKVFSEFQPPEYAQRDKKHFNQLLDGKPDKRLETIHVGKDGRQIHLVFSAKRQLDKNGNVTGTCGTAYDITDRKLAEQTLLEYNVRLEKDVLARTEELHAAQEEMLKQERLTTMGQLAGGVASELRNPLGVISNAVYYLRLILPHPEKKVDEYLGILERESQASVQIISDLLNFSNLQAGDRQPVAVSELIEDVLSQNSLPKGIILNSSIPSTISTVFVDPHQMAQALGRLVVNACQAMGNGGTLAISARGMTSKKQPYVSITVKDNGSGISPENMPRLFEPLFTTKQRHIGLGLALSKRLIEVNDGKIEVTSEFGKGSTFTVHLPVKSEGKV